MRCRGPCFCSGACQRTPEQEEAHQRSRREFSEMMKRASESANDAYRRAAQDTWTRMHESAGRLLATAIDDADPIPVEDE